MRADGKILAALKSLGEGDLLTPVSVAASSIKERNVLTALEALRKSLLSERDRETERERRVDSAVASVVHDLKTPLAVLAGYAECLEDGLCDRNYSALLGEKISEMNEMVLNILDAAKENDAKDGSEPFRFERVSVAGYFRKEFEKYRPLAEKKGVDYILRDAPDVTCRIDAAKLGRLIQNLVTNAVKYTAENGKITVSFSIRENRLAVSVSDNGEGIEKKNLPFVFDKFFREDTARSTANSGLGLYIAKEIAARHGGDLRVRSKKTKGSKFILYLPYDLEIQPRRRLFDRLPRAAKFAFVFCFGWYYCWYFRFSQFLKTRRTATLAAAFFSIPLFVFFWLIDLASIAAYNKITFLSD